MISVSPVEFSLYKNNLQSRLIRTIVLSSNSFAFESGYFLQEITAYKTFVRRKQVDKDQVESPTINKLRVRWLPFDGRAANNACGGDDLLIADIYLIFVRIRSWRYNNYCLYLGMFPERGYMP